MHGAHERTKSRRSPSNLTTADVARVEGQLPHDRDRRRPGRSLSRRSRQQQRICLDTETTSLHPRRAEIVGYSFAWAPGEACYIPVRAPAGEPQLDPTLVRDALKPVLENPAIEKIGQNLKYDMIVLRGIGIELRGIAFDTMVADYLLEPASGATTWTTWPAAIWATRRSRSTS